MFSWKSSRISIFWKPFTPLMTSDSKYLSSTFNKTWKSWTSKKLHSLIMMRKLYLGPEDHRIKVKAFAQRRIFIQWSSLKWIKIYIYICKNSLIREDLKRKNYVQNLKYPMIDIQQKNFVESSIKKNDMKVLKFMRRYLALIRFVFMSHKKARFGKRITYFFVFLIMILDTVII